MLFSPQVNDAIIIDGANYRFAEHPAVPGSDIPYGQAGRAGTVFQLAGDDGARRALKVFKAQYSRPSLVGLAENLKPYAAIPGLAVCDRSVLTSNRHGELLRHHPDLLYAVLMPWIEGQTWHEVIQQPAALTPEQSLALAHAFVAILVQLEQKGIAHGDLSGSNLIIDGLGTDEVHTELVDVEQLFAPELPRPTEIHAGSPGYAHQTAGAGLWGAEMDRFAGAVLLAEMLGWCDERVREAAAGETYFAQDELQTECPRYGQLRAVLAERWGDGVAALFERAWRSETVAQCPLFGAWQLALPAGAEEEESPAVWLAAAQAALAGKEWPAAIDAYRNALRLAAPGSSLAQELPLIIAGLEAKAAAGQAGQPVESEEEQPVEAQAERPTAGPVEAPGKKAFPWVWVIAPVLLVLAVGLLYVMAQAMNGGATVEVTATQRPPSTSTLTPPDEPTRTLPAIVPSDTPAPTASPEPTAIDTATSAPTTQPTTAIPPTLTPEPTGTPAPPPPAATVTPARVAAPPELVGPPHGTYQSPVTLEWAAAPGLTYQVTLRNVDRDITHTSQWLSGGSWTFDIPGDQFGNWEWWVSDRAGNVSEKASFVFNPHTSPGVACRQADINGDGQVNNSDWEILKANFGSDQPGNPADIWGEEGAPDGYVNILDYSYLASQYGCTYPLE